MLATSASYLPLVSRPRFIDVLVRSHPFRVFQLILGVLLILVAPIIGIPTPGPLGLIIGGFGLALVLRNSRWARRQYARYTRRHPRVGRAMDFGLMRKRRRRVSPAPQPAEPTVH